MVTKGDNVTLMCSASGIPPPMVSWMKPDGQRHSGYMLNVVNINRSQAVKLANTNVKSVMNVAMQQRHQQLMCSVSLWIDYCIYCRYFDLLILIGIL